MRPRTYRRDRLAKIFGSKQPFRIRISAQVYDVEKGEYLSVPYAGYMTMARGEREFGNILTQIEDLLSGWSSQKMEKP